MTRIQFPFDNVERVGVWLMVDHRRALRCVDLYERSKKSHSAGVTLQVKDFPEYFAALERRKMVPAEVALTDPRTVGLTDAYLGPLGITSMLDASIFIGGEVVGVLCHEHIGPPREWTTEERDFAGSMADLLALKIRAAEMEDARQVLRTQAMQLSEAKRLESLAEMAAGVAHDFTNILNLVLNARDAMPDGGSIALVLDEVDDRDEDGKPGRFVLIAVRDTGTGIAADLMDKIFDPLFSTKPRGQGTGLGLAVANQIVVSAGGFIRVETAGGQGSSFRVYLPRVSS
jgi:signal transduction histidine kinase